MKSLAVLRVAKIKCLGQLGAANSHNDRHQGKSHTDNATPIMGGGIRRLQGSEDIVQAFKDKITAKQAKPRKGAVLALEFVASASPEWFQTASQQDKERWVERTLDFLNKTVGGSENVLSAHLHDDESTPHIHLVAVPLVQKQRRRAGRKPKLESSQDKQNEGLSWALAAADIIGDKRKLEALQSDYALSVSSLGIRRGQPKSITGAKHKSPATYRAELARHSKKTMAETKRAARIETEAISYGLTVGFDAVDCGHIACAEANEDSPERLVAGPNTPSPKRWKQLRYIIEPVAKAVLQYAKARSKLIRREHRLDRREQELVDDAAELVSMAGQLMKHQASLPTNILNDTIRIGNRAKQKQDRQR